VSVHLPRLTYAHSIILATSSPSQPARLWSPLAGLWFSSVSSFLSSVLGYFASLSARFCHSLSLHSVPALSLLPLLAYTLFPCTLTSHLESPVGSLTFTCFYRYLSRFLTPRSFASKCASSLLSVPRTPRHYDFQFLDRSHDILFVCRSSWTMRSAALRDCRRKGDARVVAVR
jgi:hypothetical protein